MTPETAPSTDLARVLTIEYLEDGTVIDAETGEVLDPNSPEIQVLVAGTPPPPQIRDRWEIASEDGAEWVLERLAELEATSLAVEARRKAINDNFDALQREVDRRRKWWHLRFAGSLIEYAKATLSGKVKTRQFAHGSVAFRNAKGRREILFMDQAQAFVERWRPDLIRRAVLPVRLTDIDAAITAAVEATEDHSYRRPAFLLIEGPKTNTSISTNLPKLEGRK